MESSQPRILLARASVGLLVAMLGVGLWQGYGAWLVTWVRAHGA